MQENRHMLIDQAHKVSIQSVAVKVISAILFAIAFYSVVGL